MKIKEKSKKFEERLGTLFETAGDPILVLDKRGRLVSINHKVIELTGFIEKDLIGKHFVKTKLLTPKSKLVCLKNFAKRMFGKDIPPYEIEGLTKNGDIIPLEINANPIKEKGEIVGDLVILRDITERKKTEEKIKIFSNAVESAYDSFVLTDMNRNVTYANKSSLKTFGYTLKEIMKLNVAQFTANPEDAKKIIEELVKKGKWGGELIGIRKNKEKFPVILTISLVMDDQGHPTAMMGVFRDITERKKMEEKYNIFFNSVSDAITIVHPITRKFVDFNNAAEKLTGYSRKELSLITFDLIHPKEKLGEIVTSMKKAAESGGTASFETEILTKNKKIIPVILSGGPIKLGDKMYMQAIFKDITERKKMEEQLFESNRRLQRVAQELMIARDELKVAIETKGEFMNIAAHELKTPLQPIIGYADRLLHSTESGKWEKERLSIILDNAKRLQKLVQDVLDINKMETGIMKFSMEEVDLLKIIRDVYESVKPTVETKKLEFILDVPERPGIIKIKGDPNRLSQVFLNLIDNAVKFTDKGSITVQVQDDKNMAKIKVKDTGIGISKDNMPKIFTKFFQADGSDKRKASGTGLGLTICKEIIKAHKGKISAQSTLGEGSTFQVVLPKLTRLPKRREV